MLKVAGLALAAASIAGVFTFAEASAQEETSTSAKLPRQMATATPEGETQQKPVASSSAPSCIRKVKVIYAGLGEIHRAPCTAASD